jgi:DNA repair protein RecO (recombination protein O)
LAAEKATALVIRTTDWSETSRIATLFTRELGKVRVVAKGARRLKSNFDSALDLLTACSIVLLRKSSGNLDLLTEAQVVERFHKLRGDLQALYAAYYIAELLSEWTQDYDPHPVLFDEALETLRELGTRGGGDEGPATGVRLARFELIMLRELGYGPVLEYCAACGQRRLGQKLAFSPSAGGVLCSSCQPSHRDRRALSLKAWEALRELGQATDAWKKPWSPAVRAEIRRVLGDYITYLMGKPPRLLSYLGK